MADHATGALSQSRGMATLNRGRTMRLHNGHPATLDKATGRVTLVHPLTGQSVTYIDLNAANRAVSKAIRQAKRHGIYLDRMATLKERAEPAKSRNTVVLTGAASGRHKTWAKR